MFNGNTTQEYELHKEYHTRQGELLTQVYQESNPAASSNKKKGMPQSATRWMTIVVIGIAFIILYVFFGTSEAMAGSDDMPLARQWAILRSGETLDEGHILLADDWMLHDPQLGNRYGEAGLIEWVNWQRNLMPDDYEYIVDGHETIDNMLVVMWTMQGTHTGESEAIPATGHTIFVKGVTFHLMIDGMISESWVHFDGHGLNYQIGLERLNRPCEPICQ